MPSPEQIHELYAPVDKTGDSVNGLPQHLDKQTLASRISAISRSPESVDRISYERLLAKTGLLAALETAEIVSPTPEDPNPYIFPYQAKQSAQWLEANREGWRDYRAAVQQRDAILDTMYLGAEIRRIVGGQLYADTEIPIRDWTSKQIAVDFFKQEYERSPVVIDYTMLNVYGKLLPVLEEVGIVPATPRPPVEWFQWDQDQQKQWLADNPNYEDRARTLQLLYVGMLVNQTLEEL